MVQSLTSETSKGKLSSEDFPQPEYPDLSDIIIEDEQPMDNLFSEKQQRLLVSSLYSSYHPTETFLATANVGLFYAINQPPLVPDVLLSLDVTIPEDFSEKINRSYFTWHLGKPPEVVIEIVSNKIGNELGSKLQDYARVRIAYYLVFDPLHCLGEKSLYVYELKGTTYELLEENWLAGVELGLTLWQGKFEGKHYQWLRWCDCQGNLLLTGDEQAKKESQRVEQEKQRADYLEEILRAQGIEF